MNKHLVRLAEKYPTTKFCRATATRVAEKYPDDHCPTILIYKNGKAIVKGIRIDRVFKMTFENFEKYLGVNQAIDFEGEMEDEEIQYYKSFTKKKKLGKTEEKADDLSDSDDDDRGYVSLNFRK